MDSASFFRSAANRSNDSSNGGMYPANKGKSGPPIFSDIRKRLLPSGPLSIVYTRLPWLSPQASLFSGTNSFIFNLNVRFSSSVALSSIVSPSLISPFTEVTVEFQREKSDARVSKAHTMAESAKMVVNTDVSLLNVFLVVAAFPSWVFGFVCSFILLLLFLFRRLGVRK